MGLARAEVAQLHTDVSQANMHVYLHPRLRFKT